MTRLPRPIVEAALGLYASTGRFSRGFARGKLSGDPVYGGVILGGLLPEDGLLVDLGCGRGLLLAALAVSDKRLRLLGVDRRSAAVATARQALGPRARIEEADVATYEIPPCEAVALLDVLHYLDREAQEAVLDRVAGALRPGGVLVVREADADAGTRFLAVRAAERCATVFRGELRRRFFYRGRAAWISVLDRLGFEVRAQTMRDGTPFANDLIVARRSREYGAASSGHRPESHYLRSSENT